MSERYYSRSSILKLAEITPQTLRLWEKTFEIKTSRNTFGKKIYSEDELAKILWIKHLLQKEKYTYQGAKAQLIKIKYPPKTKANRKERELLLWLKKELIGIKTALLSD